MDVTDDTNNPTLPPAWAWIFIVACGTIPILTAGGAIPTGLSTACAFAIFTLAKQRQNPLNQRLLYCAAITAICWGLFASLVMVVEKHSDLRFNLAGSNSTIKHETDLGDESKRQEIFNMAARAMADIDKARAEIIADRRKGKDPWMYKKRLASAEQRHESNIDFAAKFFRIPREEVVSIVNEGIAEDWSS